MEERRVALVTGASRRRGIAAAVAERLARDGFDLVLHSWVPFDDEMPWGADTSSDGQPDGPDAVAAACREAGAAVTVLQGDLADPGEPQRAVDATYEVYGTLDALCAVHARSSTYGLADTTAAELDLCFAVNARSIVLLAQAYAARHDASRSGRLVTFTSGQYHGAMPDEIPYAVTKGTVHQMTATLAGALGAKGITVNCVDPGPCDTGWADAETRAWVEARIPGGRWTEPTDAAAMVAWLAGPDSDRVTGQVMAADGGWSTCRTG